MPRAAPRLLLLLPTVTYRTVAFVEAARRLGVEVTVASERPSTFEQANPTGLVTLDFADPARAAGQARAFAHTHLVHGVVAVDDDTAGGAPPVPGGARAPREPGPAAPGPPRQTPAPRAPRRPR